MRKRSMSTARLLPIISLRQGRQPAMRTTRLWPPHETRSTRFLCRLSRARHSHGYHAERRCRHGRRTVAHRRQRNLSSAPNIRTPRRRRNHETRKHHHSPEQGRLDQRDTGIGASEKHRCIRQRHAHLSPHGSFSR